MLSSYSQINTLSYTAFQRLSSGGHAYLPVSPSQLKYAHFRYVSGVASHDSNSGVSVGKLQILNSLIDHLMLMKNQKNNIEQLKSDEISSAKMEKLIEQYRQEINELNKFAEDMPYIQKNESIGDVLSLIA